MPALPLSASCRGADRSRCHWQSANRAPGADSEPPDTLNSLSPCLSGLLTSSVQCQTDCNSHFKVGVTQSVRPGVPAWRAELGRIMGPTHACGVTPSRSLLTLLAEASCFLQYLGGPFFSYPTKLVACVAVGHAPAPNPRLPRCT